MIKEVANKFSEMLISQIHSTKKIRTNDKENEVENTVHDLLKYVQYFNSKEEFDTWFLDRHVDDIKIIQELSSLIYPAAVRLNASDLRCANLLERKNLKVQDEEKLSYSEFIRLQNNFRRFFKSDISERTVTLGSLRSVKNFSEVLPHITIQPENVGGAKVLRVHYQNEAFIPIPVTNRVSVFFEKEYWNATAATVVEHFVRDMK